MKEGGVKCLVVSEEKLKLASNRIRDWDADESYEPKSKTIPTRQAQPSTVPTQTPTLAPRPTPPLFKPPLLSKTPLHSLPNASANPIMRSRASLALDGPSTPQPTSSTPATSLVPPPATEPAKSKVYNYHPSHPKYCPAKLLYHLSLHQPRWHMGHSAHQWMNTWSVGRSQPRFKTPFKTGLAPGQPGRLELERKTVEKAGIALANVLKATPVKAHTAMSEAKKVRQVAFNLSASCTSLRGR